MMNQTQENQEIKTLYTNQEFAQIYYNFIQDLKLMRKYELAAKLTEKPDLFVTYFLKEIPLDPSISH